MASTSHTINHRIYCAVTGTLPPATMSRLPGDDAVKKIAQRARRKINPRPRAPVSLAGLVLEEVDCRTLRRADMLLYDNGSDEIRIIIRLQVTISPSRKKAPAGTLMAPLSRLLNCSTSCYSSTLNSQTPLENLGSSQLSKFS